MSEGNEVNQVHEGSGETQFYSSGQGRLKTITQNISQSQTSSQSNGLHHVWPPNSLAQFQHLIPPHFAYHPSNPNMPYCPQPIRPQPYTNIPYYQHNIQPSQFPHMQANQPPGNPNAHQQSINHISSEANPRNTRNWKKIEDVQLTKAYENISSDATVGVGQKRNRLWERVLEKFVELMESVHGVKPENNVRSVGACENRMNDIKSQCTRWTSARSRAFAQKHSGWSEADYVKLSHSLYEDDGKGAFKCEECWEILKKGPKWHDYCNKKSGNNNHSTSTTRSQPMRPSPSADAYVHENVPNDFIPDNMENQTPVTPMTNPTHSEPVVGNNSRGTCTPSLDGPASIDIERPPGIKKAKGTNIRQRRKKQILQAQSSANQSFNDGLMSMQSETNAKWEKMQDADRTRELKEDERYNEMRKIQALEHEMNVASNRSKLAQDRGILGQKLLDAIQLLDQMDPLSLLTSSQQMVYEIRSKTVQDYKESYEALGDMLNKLKYISPRSARQEENFASVSASQRRLFADDVVGLDD